MGDGNCDPRILLDTSVPFDEYKVKVLDMVINAMLSNTDVQSRDVAHKVLSEFKSLPDSWRYVGFILQNTNDTNTKYFSLQILEACIQCRWNILPEDEKAGIKQYVSDLTIQLASNEQICQNEKHFINKVNENLIQIVKHEWPDRWPTFISEVCKSSRTNQSICENNMRLLNLLSEEVFDFGEAQMASKKVRKLMSQLTAQFQEVFDLCMFILQSYSSNPTAVKESLVKQTLQCLAHFLKWIPFGFIFETDLIEILLNEYWDMINFRIESLKCLTEIASLKLTNEELQLFKPKLTSSWLILVEKLRNLPRNTLGYNDAKKVPSQLRIFWETFYCQLALCITAFLKNYRESIAEESGNMDALLFNTSFLVDISNIPHDETFKICLDYWNFFSETLLREIHQNAQKALGDMMGNSPSSENALLLDFSTSSSANGCNNTNNGNNNIFNNNISNSSSASSSSVGNLNAHIYPSSFLTNPSYHPEKFSKRLDVYQNILDDVRICMVDKMAKPQEVYIQFDEETGEVTREYQPDTDEIALYNTMRSTQIFLTNLGQERMEAIMLNVLNKEKQVSHSKSWNPTALNRLCYSVGSISGAMMEDVEKRFLVQVLKTLLNLCEYKRGKGNKAIIASCIMYVVGQYPRFLKIHFKFLRTVIAKLMEFMHETFPGVQDMACETFLKISQKCKNTMAANSPSDGGSCMVIDLINEFQEETKDLNEKQILLYFEAVGHIISAANMKERKVEWIGALMKPPNAIWNEIMLNCQSKPDVIFDLNVAKQIVNILRINRRIAKATGAAYSVQLMSIYKEMLQIYQLYSNRILQELQMHGSQRIKHTDVKVLHLSKRETLHLLETFVDMAAQEGPQYRKDIVENLLGELLEPVLHDYKNNTPATRDHEVLSLLSTLIMRLDTNMSPILPKILEYIFDCTLEMLKADFHSYPDHREKFYELLKVCSKHCFDGLFALPSERLKAYVESLVWAFKHEHPKVAEQGLIVTYDFLQKLITEKRDVLHEFCKLFYFSLMKEILDVLTDTLHRSGFKYQTLILMSLLRIIQFGYVSDPTNGLTKDNIMKSLCELLCRSFRTVNEKQVEAFVVDLFNYAQTADTKLFQTHVRDFLISLKEFAGDNDAFFEIERQEALARAAELEKKRLMQVPGMMAQYEQSITVRDMDDDD